MTWFLFAICLLHAFLLSSLCFYRIRVLRQQLEEERAVGEKRAAIVQQYMDQVSKFQDHQMELNKSVNSALSTLKVSYEDTVKALRRQRTV